MAFRSISRIKRHLKELRKSDPENWWCCSADYPNHTPGCENYNDEVGHSLAHLQREEEKRVSEKTEMQQLRATLARVREERNKFRDEVDRLHGVLKRIADDLASETMEPSEIAESALRGKS